jgi:hypothetical protein
MARWGARRLGTCVAGDRRDEIRRTRPHGTRAGLRGDVEALDHPGGRRHAAGPVAAEGADQERPGARPHRRPGDGSRIRCEAPARSEERSGGVDPAESGDPAGCVAVLPERPCVGARLERADRLEVDRLRQLDALPPVRVDSDELPARRWRDVRGGRQSNVDQSHELVARERSDRLRQLERPHARGRPPCRGAVEDRRGLGRSAGRRQGPEDCEDYSGRRTGAAPDHARGIGQAGAGALDGSLGRGRRESTKGARTRLRPARIGGVRAHRNRRRASTRAARSRSPGSPG